MADPMRSMIGSRPLWVKPKAGEISIASPGVTRTSVVTNRRSGDGRYANSNDFRMNRQQESLAGRPIFDDALAWIRPIPLFGS